MRRLPLALLLALALYLAHRALVLYTAFDTVSIPAYELTVMGNIAKIIQDGWYGAPLHQYYDNCGGHLVTGLLAVPFYGAFGDSYLSLKLVPVLLGVGTIVLIWLLLARHVDRRAANLAVFLFVLGPPTLTKYSMLAKGNHFENLFFQLLCFYLFYRMHTAQRKGPWLAAWAAAAGFAIFFYFGSAVLIALLALVHLMVRGPRKTLRALGLAIPAFLIGLAPLLWVQFSSDARPGDFIDSKFVSGSRVARFVERVGDLLGDKLPRSGCYQDLGPLPGRLAEVLLLALFLAAWIWALPKVWGGMRAAWSSLRTPVASDEEATRAENERFRGLLLFPLCAYLPLFILLYGASSFAFTAYGPPVEVGQFRYLVPHFTYASMLIAIMCSAGLGSAKPQLRMLGRTCAGVALALGVFAIALVDWSFAETGIGTLYPGYHYSYYNNIIMRDTVKDPVSAQLTWDFERVHAQLMDFPPERRHAIAVGIGIHSANAQGIPGMRDKQLVTPRHFDLTELLAPFPEPELHINIARGGGSFLRTLLKFKGGQDVLRGYLRALAEPGAHSLAPYVVEGLCRGDQFPLTWSTPNRLGVSRRLGEIMPAEFAWAWRRGQGSQCGRLLARGIAADSRAAQALAQSLPDPARPEFWFGVGRGWAQFEAALPPEWETWVPAEFRSQALRGFGRELRHRLGAAGCVPVFKALLPDLEEAQRAALEGGLRWSDYPLPTPL